MAYIKLPAANETSETRNIQLNGGGPGVSGVSYLLGAGASLRAWVEPEYNLIGFDPRGINNSGPSLDCFLGTPDIKTQFEYEWSRIMDCRDEQSVRKFYHDSTAIGQFCADVHQGGPATHANTVAVAADMLNFA